MSLFQSAKTKILNGYNKMFLLKCGCFLTLSLIIVFFFDCNQEYHTSECMIGIITILSVLLLLCTYYFFDFELHQFAFISLLILGGLSLLLQPVFNIPDEQSHFVHAEIISRGHFFISRSAQEFTTIQAFNDLLDYMSKPVLHSGLFSKVIDCSLVKADKAASSNAFFLYLPQAFGILLSKIFHLGTIWLLWLGRLMNLLFYSFLIKASIKIAPKLKMSIFFIALLPISIQQAGSFSPDAMINGLSILMIAFFIKLYTEKEALTKRDIIVFLIIASLVTISKVTNIFIVGLFLLIPSKKFKSTRSSILIKSGVIVLIGLIGGIYYIYTSGFAQTTSITSYLESINANSNEQLHYIITTPLHWAKGFGIALCTNFLNYVNLLSSFGWLSYSSPIQTVIILVLFGKIATQEDGIIQSTFSRTWFLFVSFCIYSITCLALYLSWTPVGSMDIDGIQGRYFIPLFLLLLITLSSHKGNNNNTAEKTVYTTNISILLFLIAYMLLLTAALYY